MATDYTYNDISLGQNALYIKNRDGSTNRTLVGQVSNVTSPQIVRNTTEVPNGITTPEVKGSLQALRFACTFNAFVPDVLNYFQPTFASALPQLEAARLLQTDAAVGTSYKAYIEEIFGSLIEWAPQQTQPNALSTHNATWLVEKYIAYTITLVYNAAGQLVKGSTGNRTNAAPENNVYSDPTTAPNFYYDPVQGHVYENGVSVMAPERAIATLGTILTGGESSG